MPKKKGFSTRKNQQTMTQVSRLTKGMSRKDHIILEKASWRKCPEKQKGEKFEEGLATTKVKGRPRK